MEKSVLRSEIFFLGDNWRKSRPTKADYGVTISTINGGNQGLFSVLKILEYSDAYPMKIAGTSVAGEESRLKFAGNGRPLQFLLREKVSPTALTRRRMKGNLNYRVIARGHNQATRR